MLFGGTVLSSSFVFGNFYVAFPDRICCRSLPHFRSLVRDAYVRRVRYPHRFSRALLSVSSPLFVFVVSSSFPLFSFVFGCAVSPFVRLVVLSLSWGFLCLLRCSCSLLSVSSPLCALSRYSFRYVALPFFVIVGPCFECRIRISYRVVRKINSFTCVVPFILSC